MLALVTLASYFTKIGWIEVLGGLSITCRPKNPPPALYLDEVKGVIRGNIDLKQVYFILSYENTCVYLLLVYSRHNSFTKTSACD
jgi:hypothetical protein